MEAAVVTVGSINGGSATNVIPDRVRLLGTLRSYDDEVRELLRRKVREVLEAAARAGGCRLELELRSGFPVLINDPHAVEIVRRVAAEQLGEENVCDPGLLPASEDFAYFLERRPGALIFLGAGNAEKGIGAPHHSPQFDIDERALPIGAELLCRLAVRAN
jgi:amidohydrolase